MIKKLLSVAFSIFLYGCAVGPDFVTPEDILKNAQLNATDENLYSQVNNDSVPVEWWQLFTDEALNTLQQRAANSNLDLQSATARIEQSRAQLGISSASLYPSFSGSASYRLSDSSDKYMGMPTSSSDTWRIGADASWELDVWGKIRRSKESATAKFEASLYEREAVRVSLSAEITHTYISLRGTQTQLDIIVENEEIALNNLALIESRLRHGIATNYEVASAKSQLATIKASKVDLENQCSVLMNALALLMGEAPGTLNEELSVHTGIPQLPQAIPAGIPSELAKRRPDIMIAEANLHAATADIGVAKGNFYPSISLTGNFGFMSLHASNLASWDAKTFGIGPSIYLPIFQGGKLKSTLELNEAKEKAAAIAYRQTVLQAWHEIDDALKLYSSEQRRRLEFEEAYNQSETAYKISKRLYEEGQTDYVSLLVAQRDLLSSEAELYKTITRASSAMVGLYKALGGGWDQALFTDKGDDI